jgi:hypothetical protein
MSVTHLGNSVRTQHLAIHKEQFPEASRDFGLLLRVFVTVEVGVGRVHLVADVTAHELHMYWRCVLLRTVTMPTAGQPSIRRVRFPR